MIEEKLYPFFDGQKLSDKKFPYLYVKYLRETRNFFFDGGEFIERSTKIRLIDGENFCEFQRRFFSIHRPSKKDFRDFIYRSCFSFSTVIFYRRTKICRKKSVPNKIFG